MGSANYEKIQAKYSINKDYFRRSNNAHIDAHSHNSGSHHQTIMANENTQYINEMSSPMKNRIRQRSFATIDHSGGYASNYMGGSQLDNNDIGGSGGYNKYSK